MSSKDKILELQNDYQKLRDKIRVFSPKVNEFNLFLVKSEVSSGYFLKAEK